MKITETIYAGRDNTFSLQLVRGGQAINLLSITGYELTLANGRVVTSVLEPAAFTEKDNGIVEIAIGDLLDETDIGRHNTYLTTFDPVNDDGVRWPDFYLKVK
jgi:hypothetical protein